MKNILFLLITLSLGVLHANTPPSLEPGSSAASLICSSNTNELQLLYNYTFRDYDGDSVFIVGINNPNTNVILSAIETQSSGDSIMSGQIWGFTLDPGAFTLTLIVTDKQDTALININGVVTAAPIVSIVSDPVMCAAYGASNFNQFVSIQGGLFKNDGLDFPTGEFNPNDNYFNTTNLVVTYIFSDGTCSNDTTFNVLAAFSPFVNLSKTNTSCGMSTGSITATISDTNIVQNITWSNGDHGTNTISNLAAGPYVVSVTDTLGCVVTASEIIENNGVSLQEITYPSLCYGQSNGSIKVVPTGLVAPISYVWSNGKTIDSISGLVAGQYTVYATDVNGCTVVKNIYLAEPQKIDFSLFVSSFPSCNMSDGVVEVSNFMGGTGANYYVTWSNGPTSNINPNVPAGIYSVNVKDDNNCIQTKTIDVNNNISSYITANTKSPKCGANDGELDITVNTLSSDTVQSVVWSTGATTEDLLNIPAGTYSCTVTMLHTGCKLFKTWNMPVVKPQMPEICMITVDSLTTTNLVVWEPVQTVGIAYYNIYRETSTQGEFVLIDTVHTSSLSYFNDVIASPKERSWSYKIGAVNFCDVESPLSPAHKTINLNITDASPNVNVSWNAYVGLIPPSYNLYRYSDANGWELIATLSNSTLNYTDNVPFTTPGLDYMVTFLPADPCTPQKAQDFNTCRSNRERGQFSTGGGVEGVSNNAIAENLLSSLILYPNPTEQQFVLEQGGNELLAIRVMDITGKLLFSLNSSNTQTQIDLSGYKSGTYFVEIQLNGLSSIRKVMKL